ncbi:hypothetical protein [Ferrimonas kyonanensis]|uniref:hypothetical protein n=1 Tax=Ferrimonas kyonanensis TaxID=364763 RepID=UPI0012EBAF03|nr:hypothetical protein [Ferrimonas kyonanensis]
MHSVLDLAHIGDVCCQLNASERAALLAKLDLTEEEVREASESLDFLLTEIPAEKYAL